MKRRTKLLITLGLLASVPVMALCAGLLYLKFGDLSRYRPKIEQLISDTLGRELLITGSFEPRVSLTTSLEASGITLANTDWGSEPAMVTVDSLSVSVNLWSLVRPPIHIHHLEIDGVRVLVETRDDLPGNWHFEALQQDQLEQVTYREYVVDRAQVDNFQLIHITPAGEHSVELDVDKLTFSSNPGNTVDLLVDGSLNGLRLGIEGQLGPLFGLLTAGSVTFDFNGGLDEAMFSASGYIDRLAGLHGTTFDLDLHGPELDAVTGPFGLPSLGGGPFRLEAGSEPAGPTNEFTLAADLGDLKARVVGSLDSLTRPELVDVEVTASGPDLAAAGALAGFGQLPPEPFEVCGGLTWQGFPLVCKDLQLRVGENVILADGALGEPPHMLGTDFSVHGQGPDISVLTRLVQLDFPADPFEIKARLLRVEKGLQVEEAEARIGRTMLEASGFVGDPPEYAGTDLLTTVRSPDISRYSDLAGIDLPPEPFEMTGRLGEEEKGVALRGIQVRLGENSARIDGRYQGSEKGAELDLHLDIEGPDLSRVTLLDGIDGIPAEPYRADGEIRYRPNGWRIRGAKVESDGILFKADGTIIPGPGPGGTELRLQMSGPDSSVSPFLSSLGGIPSEPFTAEGDLLIVDQGFELNGVDIEVGNVKAVLTRLVVPGEGLGDTELTFEVEGHDLCESAWLLKEAGVPETAELPDKPFSLSGQVTFNDAGYLLKNIEAGLGTGTLSLDGRLGKPPEFLGTDLELHGDGPDASLFSSLTGGAVPAGPFQVSGRVEKNSGGFRFEDFNFRLGEYLIAVNGTLGKTPTLEGTDLDFQAEGPGTGLFEQFVHLPHQLDKPFEAQGHCKGSPEDFTITRLEAVLGQNNFSGWFRLDLDGKPRLHGEIHSDSIVILQQQRHKETPDEAVVEAEQVNTEGAGTMLIPDDPLDLSSLNKINADVRWTAGLLILPHTRYQDVTIDVRLEDGALRVDPISASSVEGGHLDGRFSVEPAEEGYRLSADLTADTSQFNLSRLGGDSTNWIALDIDTEFQGTGRSLKEIAADIDGFVIMEISEGVLDNETMEFIGGSLLPQILDLITPRRNEKPATKLNCGVVVISINDGLAAITPLAFQTEDISLTGDGQIDLDTEEFELTWVSKPRKGFGVSVGSITDNYVKLGGTLAEPSLEATPLKAAVSSGLVVGTAGLYLVGRGLWNRITSHRKICKHALEAAEEERAEYSRR
jgi:uncharacterized protein involved in outer membrane biogenesis